MFREMFQQGDIFQQEEMFKRVNSSALIYMYIVAIVQNCLQTFSKAKLYIVSKDVLLKVQHSALKDQIKITILEHTLFK